MANGRLDCAATISFRTPEAALSFSSIDHRGVAAREEKRPAAENCGEGRISLFLAASR